MTLNYNVYQHDLDGNVVKFCGEYRRLRQIEASIAVGGLPLEEGRELVYTNPRGTRTRVYRNGKWEDYEKAS
jgi:hypothetical protein